MVPCSLVLFLEVNIPHTPDLPVSFPPHRYNNVVGQSRLSTAAKELCDWREGLVCCSEVFSLYKQAFLIMCPETVHCICRLIALLEEIGQPVPWKKWWEKPNLWNVFHFKVCDLRATRSTQKQLFTQFQTHPYSGVSLKDFYLSSIIKEVKDFL